MECNRDEAMRAKAISEKRFTRKDIFGARKFALKAQGLYPELEGIQQMISTFDVYIAAENKLNGESDWYAVLNVHPLADDETVRKKYRKLALLLHPDKNKTIGAEGAFKFVSQAWSLLSDKGKRAAYDVMRNSRASQQPSSSVPATNGFNKFGKTSGAKGPKGSTKVPPSNSKQKPPTFWTACYRCKMQYEYLRKYLNNNLLCPNCRKAFFAIETGPPRDRAVKSPTTQWSFSQQQQSRTHQTGGGETHNSGRNKVPVPNEQSGDTGGPSHGRQTNHKWNAFAGASSASTSAQAAFMVQQAYETVKREREEAQAAKKREDVLRRKNNATKRSSSFHLGSTKRKRNMDDFGTINHGIEFVSQVGKEGIAATCRSKLDDPPTEGTDGIYKHTDVNKKPQLDLRCILMKEAKKHINRCLENLIVTSKNLREDKSTKKQPAEENGCENVALEDSHSEPCDSGIKDDSLLEEVNRVKLSETSVSKFIDVPVPDPDFHVFDKDRTECSFEEDQVWAAYDNNDGMPRFYAVIDKAISRNPFKLQISWLNLNLSSDLRLLNNAGSDYVKTCGEFTAGSRFEKVNALECFSHKVRFRKSEDGIFQIVPKKGDVWALYRNWSPEWNELTTDEMINKYDMVEVVVDIMEEGVPIIPLIKVARFRTIFHRHLDLNQIRTIPKEEMSRFSHCVPSRLLTGMESQYALKGCHELDPAALPSDLLRPFSDINEEDIATMVEDTDPNGTDESKVTNEADVTAIS